MDQKTTSCGVNNTQVNREILDCIEKMQSVNLFAKDILSENQEYTLLKEAKSDNEKISKKATEKLSRYFSKFTFKHAKIKFNSIGKKINFEDLFAEANIGVLIAIKKFKLEKWGTKQKNGVKLRFSTYAQWWIKNTLNEYCLKNSSCIKFCTTKADEKVFYNITSTLNKLKINKSCKDLDSNEITKVAKKLKVKDYNVKKYIDSINVSNSEVDIENYYFRNSLIKSREEQNKLERDIDLESILKKKEYSIFLKYSEGFGLEEIAEEVDSNKETVRQIIISCKKKIISEKKLI